MRSKRQEDVLRFLDREPGASTRRVASELEMRSQDAGRVLAALERLGDVRLDLSVNGEPRSGWIPIYRTATGRELTEADFERLADEAEAGYNLAGPQIKGVGS